MVIWIGQIACHSAIQRAGCAMRTANRWGVFISFLAMPHKKKKKKKHFKHSDGYLNIFSINHKGFLLKPCNRLCAHDERRCSLLCWGAKAAHAQVSMWESPWCPGRTHGTTSSPSRAQGDPGPCPRKHGQAAALAPGIYYQLNVQC